MLRATARYFARPLAMQAGSSAGSSAGPSAGGSVREPFSRKWMAIGAFATSAGLLSFYLHYIDRQSADAKLNAPLGSRGMSDTEYRAFKVTKVTDASRDTKLLRFELPKGSPSVDVPGWSSFVLARYAPTNVATGEIGEASIRPYTPVSTCGDHNDNGDNEGFELLVKGYPKGIVSSHITSLKVGDVLEVKGPIKKFDLNEPAPLDNVGLVAGGTGITPMLQVIRKLLPSSGSSGSSESSSLNNPNVKMTLVYGSVSDEDVLLKDELDALAKKFPERLRVIYVVDKLSKASKSAWAAAGNQVGYMDTQMLRKLLPPPRDSGKIKIFVCGPPPMVEKISGPKAPDYSQGDLKGVLREIGYTPDQVFKF